MSGAATKAGDRSPVTLVKWGGGLITDKSKPELIERPTLERLASEFAEGLVTAPQPVVLGHGSGSFGHWSARDSFLSRSTRREGRLSGEQLGSAAKTADAAARLHREVITALLGADVAVCSWLASSAALDAAGRTEVAVSPLSESLERGFVPVTGGDVVLSETRGAVIWSTEDVFTRLVSELPATGWRVHRVLWLGNTNGILDGEGATISQVDVENQEHAGIAVSGSAGVDVTGGMRLRFDTCVTLAERGVESWVLDGREPGVLSSALEGQFSQGTRFVVHD